MNINTKNAKILGVLSVIAPPLVALIFSWMLITLLVQLIGFCFGWGVTLLQATGVWLLMIFATFIKKLLFEN